MNTAGGLAYIVIHRITTWHV